MAAMLHAAPHPCNRKLRRLNADIRQMDDVSVLLSQLHDLKIELGRKRRFSAKDTLFAIRVLAITAVVFPAAIAERPLAASASVSIHTMLCLVATLFDQVLLPAPFGPQIMYRSGMAAIPYGYAVRGVGRAESVVILDGTVRVTDHETPFLIVVAQRTAVLQILFKNIRLVLHGDLDEFLQTRRHAVLHDPALASDAFENQGFLVRLEVGYEGLLLGDETVDFGTQIGRAAEINFWPICA